jgi:hypothetical protein
MRKSQNEIADYLNNFEKRKRFMSNVKSWSIIFFFITYGFLLVDKVMGTVNPAEPAAPCNASAAVDSVTNVYEYKLDSVIKLSKKRRK